jgi:hypothetical protein
VRPWLAADTLERLNACAEAAGVRTESGHPVRFVPPAPRDPYYEVRVFETGAVATRAGSLHDWFNALAWLAFPRTKARINAMHARAIPGERGGRGRLRDLLTLLDEGGALVACDEPALAALARAHRWRELFWDNRARVLGAMRVLVLGHAVLEKSLDPWPGITCKAIFVPAAGDADAHAARWLRELPADATPRSLAALPIFGYPGWLPASADAAFYADARFFRGARE